LNIEGKAILILDSILRNETWKQLGPRKVLPFQRNPAILSMLFNCKKSSTIAGLAKKCGFSPLKLYSSIEQYNSTAKGGADSFGKSPEDCRGINKAPFYAIDVSIDSKFFPCAVLTLGGLVVNEETGNVKDENGEDIKGLFAAGRTAVGICSNIYVSGLSIGDCIFSGRRAGLHASLKA
jgi:3-oxo-5alpha-steroid 4-dehydrogenase